VRAHRAEVVDIELKPERGGWVLRVYVEKAGAAECNMSTRDAAVNLELCANVSRDLGPALDVADLLPHAYHLEVSSPGVERPLRGESDFTRFAGHKAKLKLRVPIAADGAAHEPSDGAPPGRGGQRVVVGILDGVAEGKLRVREGARTHEIPLSSIDGGRLVFEFGSAAKEHRPHAQSRPKGRKGNGRDTQQRKH
jgi:ribosome maturation factor RimP